MDRTVCLVANSYNVKESTGMAVYARRLTKGLEKRGISFRLVYSKDPFDGVGITLNNMFILPYKFFRARSESRDGFDLIHALGPSNAYFFPLVGGKKIVTCHELTFLLAKDIDVLPYVKVFGPLMYQVTRFADRVISISELTKRDLVKYVGVPEEKIRVVNQGVDDRFKPIPRARKETLIIGYVGAVNYNHRLHYLITTFCILKKRYPGLKSKLMIVGPARRSYYLELLELAKHLGVAKDIEFRGFVEDIVETYNTFDVFVLPTEWRGFSIPVLEAQRCGVPVIVRGDGHIASEISTFCAKASSHQEMADKIYEILTDDWLREKIIRSASTHSSQFSWERTVSDTVSVYEEVLA